VGLDDCIESKMLLRGEIEMLVVAEADGRYVPIALPISGSFDREYGLHTASPSDGIARAVLGLADRVGFGREELPSEPTPDQLLELLHRSGCGGRLDERVVSVALVDREVFQAIVLLVEEAGVMAWQQFARTGLEQLDRDLPRQPAKRRRVLQLSGPERDVLAQILAAPDEPAARTVYVDLLLRRSDPRGKLLASLPAIDSMPLDDLFELALPLSEVSRPIHEELRQGDAKELRRCLSDLARFLAWGTHLEPSYRDHPAFYGHWPLSDVADVMPRCEQARARYAGIPLLLEVVAANERAWRDADGD
jgi:hypothetical protein